MQPSPISSSRTFLSPQKIARYPLSNHFFSPPHHSSSVYFSRSVVSDSLWPHGLQHARPPCPSPSPGVYSNSCPWSRWCHSTISSSVIPFSSHLQSFPASGSFQMSQPFASGGKHEKTILNIAPHKHFFSIKWYKLLGWGFFSVSCHLMLWLIHLALYDKGQERKENSLKYMYQYWVRSQIH